MEDAPQPWTPPLVDDPPEMPVVTVAVPFDRTRYGLAGLVQAAWESMYVDQVILLDYSDNTAPVARARVEELRAWCDRMGQTVIRSVVNGILSDCWNLAGGLARAHADSHGRPWILILLDQDVIVTSEGIDGLVDAVIEDFDVAFLTSPTETDTPADTPADFDGRAFAIGAEAGTGLLLTSHDHVDRRTCALDFIATLDAEADIGAIPAIILL